MKRIKVDGASGKEDMQELFRQYLDICNQAIEKNKDDFPYQQAFSLGEKLMGERPIELAIYDDEPKAAFSLHLKNNKLKNDGEPEDVKKAWRVNLSYLRQVVEHPEEYIKHPEKLDLAWLKSRLGL